jgi:hypothetical protein
MLVELDALRHSEPLARPTRVDEIEPVAVRLDELDAVREVKLERITPLRHDVYTFDCVTCEVVAPRCAASAAGDVKN